ncbi:CPBP family intramembrane glutamic endopeptidase [Flavobacterium sp. DG2-3]|uniref:CPBP family intramembrane glutamic endopeptidase n=1 Tax=Flavobacterium sp. DG2-3 TaxID=3068317 RepID=UPI00273E6254|nr:CPBP family intramembrane glutamic endopeptidase [Flavobacterium sp. DG2-3]MDP5202033.1 CPBP family intramembrane metalloprotease [Flavobacterium sp. DG2-3]
MISIIFDIIISVCIFFFSIKDRKIFKFGFQGYYIFFSLLIVVSFLICQILITDFFYGYYEKSMEIDGLFMISILIKSLTEEVVFRGFFLDKFLKKYKETISIIIVSIGFALLHVFSRSNVLLAFISSIIISVIFIKRRSIIDCFVIHLSINLFSIFLLPEISNYFQTVNRIYLPTYFFIIFVVFLVSLFFFIKKLRIKTFE